MRQKIIGENGFFQYSGFILCVVIVVTSFAVYWQTKNFEFINYDDPIIIYENQNIQTKFSVKSIKWVFTASHADAWQPLTWLTYLIGYQFYGLNPGWHHLTNVFFHIANAILLFLVLRKLTGATYKSAFVAFIFSLHPVHVESVAWITERKDVLCAFFWILTIWSYYHYVKRPGFIRYIPVFIFVFFCLMSKPMGVTLPFSLLLLDLWPLGRVDALIRKNIHLVLEKIPLFIPAAITSIITVMVTKEELSFESFPLDVRISNALLSYVKYIFKLIWPFDLSVFYPLPHIILYRNLIGAFLVLLFIFILSIYAIKKYPWFTVGWFWYMGTLIPAIGIVQVGGRAMADRFAYIPFIGLYIIISWGIPPLLSRWSLKRKGLAVISIIFFINILAIAFFQVRHWRNSIALFEHAINVTDKNALAHTNLGLALYDSGNISEAIRHYNEALKISPYRYITLGNLGIALIEKGRLDEAIICLEKALQLNPKFSEACNNMGMAFKKKGQTQLALKYYSKALEMNPSSEGAHTNLGALLYEIGEKSEAMQHYQEALRLNPKYADAHNNIGIALRKEGRLQESLRHFSKALKIHSDSAMTHSNLGALLYEMGRKAEAIEHYEAALRLNPNYADARNSMGCALLDEGKPFDAFRHLSMALQINSSFAPAHNNIGMALANMGRISEAKDHYKEAIRLNPDFAEAYNNLGIVLYRENNKTGAIEQFQTAIHKMPQNESFRHNLNIALEKDKNITD